MFLSSLSDHLIPLGFFYSMIALVVFLISQHRKFLSEGFLGLLLYYYVVNAHLVG